MEALLLAATLASAPKKLAAAEKAFVAYRDAEDAQRHQHSPAHERDRLRAAQSVDEALKGVDPAKLSEDDRRAIDAMRRAISPGSASGPDAATRLAYEAFGRAASSISFEGQRLDRLTVLARLGSEPDQEKRHRLFLSLAPVWASMSGPFPDLVASRRDAWAAKGA